jgi:putative redox protein
MDSLVVTVTQRGATTTSEGLVREHRVLVDRPAAKGGSDRGPMGGELLLLALGGCFMSNLIAAAAARSIAVSGLAVTVRGELASAPPRFDVMTVEVRGEAGADPGALDKLILIAERACIVHNTLAPAVKLAVRRAAPTAGY